MNERMQELIQEANEQFAQQVGEQHKYYYDGFVERFAKLLVRDALYVVKLTHGEGNEDMYSYDDALDHVEQNMKQHFGVQS